jgi:hypothetical protein
MVSLGQWLEEAFQKPFLEKRLGCKLLLFEGRHRTQSHFVKNQETAILELPLRHNPELFLR